MTWTDRYDTRAALAAALDALGDRAPVVTLAAMALRLGEASDELADALDDHAHLVAMRWGAYDAHGVCVDAAEALRPIDEPETGITTGTFRAIRSSVIDGVAVTEYEAEEPTARYVAIGLGHPEQPPELVRCWAADPDDVDDADEF